MWQIEQDLACSGCGLPRDETQARERQGAYRAKPRRCFACQAIGQAAETFTSGPHDPHGVMYAVEPDL